MNVILATGNRSVDRFAAGLKEVTVLTTLQRREQVIDRALQLNPHVLLLANSLNGRMEFRDIIGRLRSLKPGIRIVFLYGAEDQETRLFLDFLVRHGVYDFVVGGIDEYNLQKALLEPATLEDVTPHLLPDLPQPEPETVPAPSSIPVTEPVQHDLEILIVEKIVERETVRREYLGNITVGVAGLFPRCGVTHTALLAGRYLRRQKRDAGVVVSPSLLQELRAYYQIQTPHTEIAGVPLYDDYVQAASSHAVVVVDEGCPGDDMATGFYSRTIKLLVCPSAPWEIDRLTDLLRDNPMAKHIRYIFFPIADSYFRELRANLQRGGCHAWQLTYAPDWTADRSNDRMLGDVLRETASASRASGATAQKDTFVE